MGPIICEGMAPGNFEILHALKHVLGASEASFHAFVQYILASFPGSSAWAEEKEPGTHCLRMLSSPRISGNLEIFRKICSITLTSVRYADFSRIKDGCH